MGRLAARLACTLALSAVLAGTGGASGTPSARVPSTAGLTATLGGSSGLPPAFFGVNFPYSEVAKDGPATEAQRDGQLAALHPGTLRWPGGTDANYFRWQLGYPEPAGAAANGLGQVELNGFVFTLSDLKAAYKRTGAPPVFDLNLMTPVDLSEAARLGEQVALLKTAQHMGLPIAYVELGNEFYLSTTDYTQSFPDATSYGQTVAYFVSALHRDFPGVLVAAVGSLPQGTSREQTWDSEMLNAAATANGLPDAVTLHAYPNWTTPLTVADLPGFFAEAYSTTDDINDVVHGFPDPEPVWVTEYNLYPQVTATTKPAQYTYAHALFVAEQELLLQQVTGVALVDYWTSFGNAAAGAYTGGPANSTLTPVGLALAWVGAAASDATRTAPLVFEGAPALGNGEPAVLGYAFSSATAVRDVIVNLSGQSLSVQSDVPGGFGAYIQVTGDPTTAMQSASQLTRTHGTAAAELTLAPYSITLSSREPLPSVPPIKPPPCGTHCV